MEIEVIEPYSCKALSTVLFLHFLGVFCVCLEKLSDCKHPIDHWIFYWLDKFPKHAVRRQVKWPLLLDNTRLTIRNHKTQNLYWKTYSSPPKSFQVYLEALSSCRGGIFLLNVAETSHALIISQAIVNGANSISDRQLLSINKRKWGAWSLGMNVFLKFSELMTAFHLAHLRPCQWVNGLVSVAKSWHDELMICLNSENLFEFVNNFNSRPLPGVGYLRLLFQLELLLSVNYWTLCHVCPNWKRK